MRINTLLNGGLCMFFWLFMLVMDLLIPLAMIVFGRRFARKPPEKINEAFGYRTIRSMRSAESWDFAHRHFGRLWFLVGLVLLPLSVIPLLFVLHGDAGMVGIVGGLVCVCQCVPMLVPAFFTESALKKKFGD